MALVTFDEYKGQPIIQLCRDEEDRFPFQFGLAKARLIVECFDDIQQFVEDNETEEKPKRNTNGKAKPSKKKGKKTRSRNDDDE